MNWRKAGVAVTGAVLLFASVPVLVNNGIVNKSDFSPAIAGFIVFGIPGLLVWGFRDDIDERLRKRGKSKAESKEGKFTLGIETQKILQGSGLKVKIRIYPTEDLIVFIALGFICIVIGIALRSLILSFPNMPFSVLYIPYLVTFLGLFLIGFSMFTLIIIVRGHQIEREYFPPENLEVKTAKQEDLWSAINQWNKDSSIVIGSFRKGLESKTITSITYPMVSDPPVLAQDVIEVLQRNYPSIWQQRMEFLEKKQAFDISKESITDSERETKQTELTKSYSELQQSIRSQITGRHYSNLKVD